MDCALLARLVADHRLDEDEAMEVARDLAYDLVREGLSAVTAGVAESAMGASTSRGQKASRPGRVRWTICAMLFAATSINYMDRQVIAILKPTLQHNIGLTEVSYGYIVFAFQLAYAMRACWERGG